MRGKRAVQKRSYHIPASCPTGKRSYVTRIKAREAGHKAQRINGAPFDVYRCMTIYTPNGNSPGCGQYHLTTRRKVRA